MNHLHSVILMLNSTDMVNTSDVRLAVSRFTTWTSDTKSFDVRKVIHMSEAVFALLCNLILSIYVGREVLSEAYEA